MNRHRISVVPAVVFAISLITPVLANAATTVVYKTLIDSDNSTATGCVVPTPTVVAGIDEVLLTTMVIDGTTAAVTKVEVQRCVDGSLSAPATIDATGWPAGPRPDGRLVVETHIPYSEFGGTLPPSMRLRFVATVGSNTTSVLQQASGDPILFSTDLASRHRVVMPGGPRTIVLDGSDSDWSGVPPLVPGVDSLTHGSVKLTGVFAFAGPHDLFFYFQQLLEKGVPIATDDTYTVRQGQSIVIAAPGVLANDTDPAGGTLSAALTAPPIFGNLTLAANGGFTYTQNGSATPSDTFKYTASNGTSTSDPATVTLVITPDSAPVAVPDSYSVVRGLSVTVPAPGVLANDTDADGDSLTAAIVTPPAHAATPVVVNADGSFTYTHDDSNTTADSFTYRASDGILNSAPATVTLTVLPRNHAPSFTAGPNETVLDTAGAQTFPSWASSISAGPADEAGQALNFIVSNNNNALFTVQPAISPAGTLTFTPTVGQVGVATVTVQLHDNGGTANGGIDTSAVLTFTITVDKIPVITSANATTFQTGVAGTFAVTASARPPADIAESGALPAGVTFVNNGPPSSSSGTLAGTPAAGTGGLYPITFTATNVHGSSAPQAFTLTVNQPPAITSASATTFTTGAPGTFTITTTGFPAAALSQSGALPAGVTFTNNGNGTATLAGTPNSGSGGVYPITITASNGVSPNATQTFTLTVDQAPAITSASAATFIVGTPASFNVTATGFPIPAITRGGVALPAGITFVDNGNGTATLSGTAAAATGGTYAISFAATNGVGAPASQNFTLTIDQPPAITSANATTFTVGAAATFSITTTGFPTNVALSESGALPAGVTFTNNGNGTATLAGTPSTATGGVYAIAITGSNGVVPNATQNFTLTVDEAPAITSANAATFLVGQAATFTVVTRGFPHPSIARGGVALPSGITFVDNGNGTGTLSGTAAAATGGTYAISFTATNGVGAPASQSFTLTIDQPPAITSASAVTFTAGAPATFTVTTSGFPTAVALTETGALPPSLTFVDNGNGTATLAGTPGDLTGGVYPITITGNNGVAPNATQNFVLTVNQVPAITSANSATFTVGVPATFTVTTRGFPKPSIVQTGMALPTGVTFTDNGDGTGTLAGTPAAATSGVYDIVFTATNAAGTGGQSFSLTVNEAPAITSANAATFTVGAAATFTVTTSGYPTNVALSESGGLPAGVTFVDNGNGTATIGGTPNAGSGGVYPLTITGNNGVTPNATQNFTLTVDEAPAITSASAVTFLVGTPQTFTVTTTGFPTPSIVRGGVALPAGITFVDNGDGTGTLSGTAAAATGGTYAITFTPNNGIGAPAAQNFTLTIHQAPAITSANAATFTVGAAGSFTVTTTGYPTNVALGATGTLPGGVTFTDNGNGTATLAGTPSAGTGGVYPLTITGTNGVTPNATQNFTLTVDEAPSFTSPNTASFTVGATSTFNITTHGYPSAATISSLGTLPNGVTFTNNGNGTATLSGNPVVGTGGGYVLNLSASNGVTPNASQVVNVTVYESPLITSATQATFAVGQAGSFNVTVTSYTNPNGGAVAFSESGTLPSGVTFTDNHNGTATLAGTPAAATGGAYPIVITANNGIAPNATQNFTLDVDQAPAITSANQATFQPGTPGTFTVTTSGFPTGASMVIGETGPLPTGLTFTDNHDGTATIAGTASGSGSYPISISASNGITPDASQSFTIKLQVPPAITSGSATTFVTGSAGTFTVTATGVPTPTLSSTGPLPSGVTFTDNGNGTATLGGVPGATSGGVYPLTITATNGVLPDAVQNFTLTVNQAPLITSASSTTFAPGKTGQTFNVTTTGFPTGASMAISETGTLPAGVTLTDNGDGTATFSGTPAAGTQASSPYNLTITANNGVSPNGTQPFVLNVTCPTITVTGTSSFALTFNTAMASSTYSQSGGNGTMTWSAVGLPTNLSINSSTGVLSGTPAVTGTFAVTVTATDAGGCAGTKSVTITVSPVASPDSFSGLIDNTQFAITGGTTTAPLTPYIAGSTKLTANDTPAGGISVTAGTFTTTAGGSVTIAADGTFIYTPLAKNGLTPTTSDSFSYTISSNTGSTPTPTTATATVTLSLAGRIWYVQNNAGSVGSGTSNAPFQSLANAGTNSTANDVIYVYTGDGTTTNQNAGITLKTNQLLAGQGAAFPVGGVTNAPGAGTAPSIGNATGDVVAVASGNTIRGVKLTNAANSLISGAPTNLTVSNVTMTPSGTANGFNLTGGSGTIAVSNTTMTGTSTGDVVRESTGTESWTFTSSPITQTNGRAVNISGKTGGGMSFDSASTITVSSGTTDGAITLSSNSGSPTFAFSRLTLTTSGTARALVLSSTGTVSNSDTTSTIATADTGALCGGPNCGAAIDAASSSLSLTFRSVNVNGSNGHIAKGMVLNNTTGSLTVAGNGGVCTTATPTCSGGTIQNTTVRGVELTNATNVSLNLMHLFNAQSTNGPSPVGSGGCQPDNSNGSSNTACNAALWMSGVNTVTIDHSHIDGAKQMGIVGNGVATLTFTNNEVNNNGTLTTGGGTLQTTLSLENLTGTSNINANNFHDANGDHGVYISNTSGSPTINFNNNTMVGSATPTALNQMSDGLTIVGYNFGTNLTVNASTNAFSKMYGSAVNWNTGCAGSCGANFTGTLTGGSAISTYDISMGQAGGGTANYTINNVNPIQNKLNGVDGHGNGSAGIAVSKVNGNGTMTASITNNVVTRAQCGGGCDGIFMGNYGAAGSATFTVTGNNVSGVDNEGIAFISGQGAPTSTVTVQSNTIGTPFMDAVNCTPTASCGYALDFISGTQSGDTSCVVVNVGNMDGNAAHANQITSPNAWAFGGNNTETVNFYPVTKLKLFNWNGSSPALTTYVQNANIGVNGVDAIGGGGNVTGGNTCP